MKKYTLKITFEVMAPVIVKATSTWEYGVDMMFNRDENNRLAIPSSHIKGKLREALRELSLTNTEECMGKASGDDKDGGWDPIRGSLTISDFTYKSCKYNEGNFCRVSIDGELGVSNEGQLFVLELPFKHGKTVEFDGEISFIDTDEIDTDKNANAKEDNIKKALRWINAIGAFNSVGFGNVKSVKIERLEREIPVLTRNIREGIDIGANTQFLDIEIRADEPLVLGGQRHKANYLESLSYIPGSVIKGAFAKNLIRHFSTSSRSNYLSELKGEFAEHFSNLVANFDNIRFTHAFPTQSKKRPIQIPLSVFKVDNRPHDALTIDKECLEVMGFLEFQVDWKDDSDMKRIFRWVEPKRIFRTRTAIDSELRSAEHEKLFTYQYVCPTDDDGREIVWRGRVFIPEVTNGDRDELTRELIFALNNYLTCIGKGDSKISVRVKPATLASDFNADKLNKCDKLIFVLQSDTIMVNPDDMLKNKYDQDTLEGLYKKFWSYVSGNSLEMKDYFAAQDIHGGYMVKRFQKGKHYYPFYVTSAGSAFLLNVSDPKKAATMIKSFQQNGLPIPDWAIEEYKEEGTDQKPFFRKCPFIPQNGYGEVKITPIYYYEKFLKGCDSDEF